MSSKGFGYQVLYRNGKGKAEDGVELQAVVLDGEGVGMEETESGSDGEGMMELGKGGREEDQETLIREEPEIDENGEARDYEVALKHAGFGLFQALFMCVNGFALLSDAVELLSVAFVLDILRRTDEFSATDAENALLSSVIFIGMLCGSYTWGGFADIIGRRTVLIASLVINGVFGASSAFSPNIYVFILCRFFSGIGVGGSLPVVGPYTAEFVLNKYRGTFMSLQALSWSVGRMLCGATAWLILPLTTIGWFHSWRLFVFLSSLPALCGSLLYLFLPESPRYLLEHGRTEKAMKNLRLVHRLNHLHKKEAHFSIKSVRVKAAHADHGDRIVATTLSQRWLVFKQHVKQLVSHTKELYGRTNFKRTILMSTILFTLSFGSYGVMLWFPSYVQQITDAERASEFSKFCHDTPSTNNVSLSDYCDCQGSSFSHQHFINTNFSNFKLTNCSFHSVLFKDITFTDTLLEDCMFINCSLDNVRFGSGSELVHVKWDNTVLDGVNVSQASVCEEEVVVGSSGQERGGEGLAEGGNRSCGPVREVDCMKTVDQGKVYRDLFLVAFSATPGNIVSAIAVYFMRRNYWMAISMFSSTASVFLLYVAKTEVFVVVVLCIFTALSAPAWNDSGVLNADLYPTHLRSSSLGMHLLFARIGAILGTNIFGLFIHVNPAVPILLVSSLFLVGSIASLPLPKTTRKTLLK